MKPLLESINFTLDTINNTRFLYSNIYQEMVDIQLNYNNQYCPIIFEDNSIDYDTDCLYETLDMIFESELSDSDKIIFLNELVQSVLEETTATPKTGIKTKIVNGFKGDIRRLNNSVNGFGTSMKKKFDESNLGKRIISTHKYNNNPDNKFKSDVEGPKGIKQYLKAAYTDSKNMRQKTGLYHKDVKEVNMARKNIPIIKKKIEYHQNIINTYPHQISDLRKEINQNYKDNDVKNNNKIKEMVKTLSDSKLSRYNLATDDYLNNKAAKKSLFK